MILYPKRCLVGILSVVMPLSVAWADESGKTATNAYFGAVHVHTSYSFDAYTNGTLTSPAHAYQWAQGKAIPEGEAGRTCNSSNHWTSMLFPITQSGWACSN